MNNSELIFLAIFFSLGGLAFIGLGCLSLKYDTDLGERFIDWFVSDNRYVKKAKNIINRIIGYFFIVFGSIFIISAVVMLITG